MTGIAPVQSVGEVPITHLVRRKIKIAGSFGARARVDTPVLLKLLAEGRIGVDSITKRFRLEEVKQAYEQLSRGEILGKAIVEF